MAVEEVNLIPEHVKKLFPRVGKLPEGVVEIYREGVEKFSSDSNVSDECRDKVKQTLCAQGRVSAVDGYFAGSNPFIQAFAKRVLPEGSVLVTRPDLEEVVELAPGFLADNYVDFGVSLVTAGDNYEQNDLVAKRLAGELGKVGKTLKHPQLIYTGALEPVADEESNYGLVFVLTEEGKDEAKSFIVDRDSFKWHYIRDDGLSCAYLYRNSVWCAGNERFDYSYSDGRVVVKTAEGSSQKILELKEAYKQLRRGFLGQADDLVKRIEAAKQKI